MIDHAIIIGGTDVSKHVISCSVDQTIENDSDPGKMTVVLANIDQIYTDRFVPQLDIMGIDLFNFVYSKKPHYWTVAIGHVTDAASPAEEITVKGECDLGHLSDYLSKEYNFNDVFCKDVLITVLNDHDPPMGNLLDFEVNPDIKINPVTYDANYTYQGVLEDIRTILGAVFYFDWDGRLKFRDPRAITSYEVLDPFVSEPTRARSIMSYCNAVTVKGYAALDEFEEGSQTGDHNPIIAWYPSQDNGLTLDMSDEEIQTRHLIVSPPHDAYNIHTQDEAFEAAEKLYNFYETKKDSLTEIIIEGWIPPLQSLVRYTSFEDPDGGIEPKQLYGVVLNRKIEYSADGLKTTISIHPKGSIDEVRQQIWDLLGEPPAKDETETNPTTDTNGNPLSDLYNWFAGLNWNDVTWGQ